MTKSKIFYGLCIAAFGLSFAEAMAMAYKWPTSPNDKQLINWNSVETTKLINRFNNSLSNNDRNRLINALNFYIKNSQQVCVISQPIDNLTRGEVRGYEMINELAKRLLWCIDMKCSMCGEYNRTDLEMKLQDFGICRRSDEHGDDLLKIQLDSFLNPHKYEKWPRNDYNELVWKSMDQDYLTDKQRKTLKYLSSIGGENGEICDTFKDVFMRTLSGMSVSRYRERKESLDETTGSRLFYKKSFDKKTATLKLTEFEKNRLIRSIRGYEINRIKLVVFLSNTGKYKPKDILSIFDKLYDRYARKYSHERINGWKNGKHLSEKTSMSFNMSPENLAKELYDLGFCQAFADCGMDEIQCDRFKKCLEMYNDVTFDKKRLLKDTLGYKVNQQKLAVFLANTGKYRHKDILSIFDKLYNEKYSSQTIYRWIKDGYRPIKISKILAIPPEDLAKELYDLGVCQAFAYCGVDKNLRERFKKLLKDCGVEVQEENNAVVGTELAQDDNNLIYNSNCQQNMTTDQISTQFQENDCYMNNEYIEMEEDCENEVGFMQFEYYSNYKF